MNDASANEHLITGIVHFDVQSGEESFMANRAREMLGQEIEQSDVLGSGWIATIRPTSGETAGFMHEVSAVILFRQIGADADEAKEIAAAILEEEVLRSSLLRAGGVCNAEIQR